MPVYEYRCKGCGYQFEQLSHTTNPPGTVRCEEPDCEDGEASRIISMPMVMIRRRDKAVNAIEIGESDGYARHCFENEPDPAFGGMTAQQAVRAGLARTKDMKRDV